VSITRRCTTKYYDLAYLLRIDEGNKLISGLRIRFVDNFRELFTHCELFDGM
jgi:hypothetical protein